MLRLEGLHAGYPHLPVLLGVDLALADGATVAVLGRNGVGKTTLIRAVMGLVAARTGRITLDGADLTRVSAHRRARLGVTQVPQGRDIFPGLTVAENLEVAALAHGPKGRRERVERALEEFPVLAARARAAGETLSGGQQQILAIARALVAEPRILLLDEPTEGVQPSILDEIAATLLRVNRERGVSILLAEQNLDFAGRITDRALVMDQGRIGAELPMRELQGSRDLQRELLAV